MNIGIIVPHLGASQISFYAIKAINQLVQSGYKDDLVLFFENLVPPILSPQCATICINELMSFKGVLITTTIDNTTNALAMNSRKDNQIIFYVWDLEWMRPGKNAYLYNYKAFQQATKIIARSQAHAKAIENYSNRKVDLIIEEFNIERIIE